MSKRKFKEGQKVVSVAEILEHDWFVVRLGGQIVRTVHRKVLECWQLRLCESYVNGGQIFIAKRLTNEEYYSNKSDDEIQAMLDTDLCDVYCPLPESLKGVHCYGGEPVMCEGSHCVEALERWKEEEVE